MKGISNINRILFPTDFSKDSIQALSSAIDLAKQHDAELILLYAYRLIKTQGSNEDISGLKASLALEANQEFIKLKELKLNSSKVKTSFLCEVGFLSDRLLATVDNEKIDFLVISSSIEKTLKKEMKNARDILTSNLDCKVLFLS